MTGDNAISISFNGASRFCGVPGEISCSGPFQSAQYNVQGTKGMQVRIRTTPSTLTNVSSGGGRTVPFTPFTFAPTLVLTNSGSPGTTFHVGGYIVIGTTTVDGLYSGDIDLTVEYQ